MKLAIKVKRGRQNAQPLRTWVMLASEVGEEPEFGTWLTPSEALNLAQRLTQAAGKAALAEVAAPVQGPAE
jgi:hypothetical protein